jgi:hypothetical protein
MVKNKKHEAEIRSNDVLRGKPYLDIDRVIDDGTAKGRSNQEKGNR